MTIGQNKTVVSEWRRGALLSLILLVALLTISGLPDPINGAVWQAAAQQQLPLEKSRILDALSKLRRGDPQNFLVEMVEKRGVRFPLTDDVKKELGAAGPGASAELLKVIERRYVAPPTPVKAPAPTTAPAIPEGPPLTKEAVSSEVAKGTAGQRAIELAALIKVRGVEYKLSETDELRLYQAAVDKTVIDAIKLNYRPPIIENNEGFLHVTFVALPEGEFQMGAEKGDEDEQPAHTVRISRGFEMGKYEVTQAEWRLILGTTPSRFNGLLRPVENVSWEDVQDFIKRLNERNDGYLYRLPTEAEWEYACRAGTTGDYAGNLDEMGWHAGNSNKETQPVGQKKPNRWKLHDMHGNVREWVQDWYEPTFQSAPATDPRGPNVGTTRVSRNGGWKDDVGYCRSSNRAGRLPGHREDSIGFRLVRMKRNDPPPPQPGSVANTAPAVTPTSPTAPVPNTAPIQQPTPKPEAVKMSNDALMSSATRKVSPAYPPMARTTRAQGAVQVAIEIDEKGNVSSANAINGPTILREAAVQAAKQWRFTPARVGGAAVRSSGILTFNFTL